MRMKLIAALVLTSFIVGCASAPPSLDTTKPVEFTHSMWQPSLRQNGIAIDQISAMNAFANIPEAVGSAQTAKALFWSSIISAAVGGWFLGAGVAGKSNQGENLAVSAGFIGLSFLLGHFHLNSLAEASEQYNMNLKPAKKRTDRKSGYSVEPGFAPVAGGIVGGFTAVF